MLSLVLPQTNLNVNFIGDPHFGKKFGDVPLHRRGEREEHQRKVFCEQLLAPSDVTIIVGDLFDTFIVSHETLWNVYQMMKLAAEANPSKHYLVLMGNHDVSRDSTLVSSFMILKAMLVNNPNIDFYTKTQWVKIGRAKILMCPYSEFKTAEEEVKEMFEEAPFDLVVGHWDTISYGNDHNVLPAKLLVEMTDIVVTGHEHNKRAIGIDKDGTLLNNGEDHWCDLFITGSMIPYSHAEDPEETLYVTRTLSRIEKELATDPSVYHDKCLRVLLGSDEQVPEGIDCLQFTVKKVEQAEASYEVKMDEAFSFEILYRELMRENEVPDDLADHYWTKMQQEKTDAY